MNAATQVLVVVLALVVALSLAMWAPRRRWQGRASTIACVVAALLIGNAWLARELPVAEAEVTGRPVQLAADGYVGSSACRACHPHEHDTWHDSYHRSMTQRVDAHSVLADWDGVTLSTQGKTWRLLRKGAGFWIDMEDPVVVAGATPGRVQRQVVMSTGSHHMQVYWYESTHGRVLGLLPFSWQIAERRWITRLDSFVQPASDPLQLGLGAWNLVCIKCHATHARPRLDMDPAGLHGADSQVAEFGIACEACHGPGEAHAAAHRNPTTRYAQRLAGGADPTIVDPRDLPWDRSTMVCGQCHGLFDYQFTVPTMNEWFQKGFAFRPGGDVLKDRRLKFEGDGQFWSDGLVRVAGREYNALAKSACHEQGHMTCLSCHVLHAPSDDPRPREQWQDDQLHADAGDRSCLQCHARYAEDVAAHTHHAAASEGSRCMNCHMPHTTYGLMKGVRTHRIASPSVLSTLATGRPNACNQCHLDRPLSWTAEHLATWYGTERPALGGDDTDVAAGVVWALKGDAAQRALVAWSLGWQPAREASGTDWMVPLLAELLDDPYGAVRIIAERSLRTLPAYHDLRYDPGADEPARKALKGAVLATWRQDRRAGSARPAVLLAADGGIDAAGFARLLRRRDLRLVRLEE